MAKAKKKKQSIREFVSEDSLKFQLYLLKYSNQIKQLNSNTTKEIEELWKYSINKKNNRFKVDLRKVMLEESVDRSLELDDIVLNDDLLPQEEDSISIKAIKKNIIYVNALPAPTTKEGILANFELARVSFIKSLEKRIEENKTATLKLDVDMLEYAKSIKLEETVSKEKFGQMLLLMIKNIATMPSFSGYSDNWKTDFYSNAIEKTLLYLDNFDENLLSKRTGERSKAFAYVTQICFNAFVNIINIRKQEDGFLKNTISLESANLDGMKNYSTQPKDEVKEVQKPLNEYIISIKKLEDLDEAIIKGIEYIENSNDILLVNRCNISEIEDLLKNTPKKDQDEDFMLYIKDMRYKILPELSTFTIDTLRILKPANITLGDWEIPSDDVLKGINIIITQKTKKAKKAKKPEPKPEIVELTELEEFDNEW